MHMYLKKVISKKKRLKKVFVAVLEVTDKNSRILIQIRIRIRAKILWICITGFDTAELCACCLPRSPGGSPAWPRGCWSTRCATWSPKRNRKHKRNEKRPRKRIKKNVVWTIPSAGSVEVSCVGGCSGSKCTKSGSKTMLSGEIRTRTQIHVLMINNSKNFQFRFF